LSFVIAISFRNDQLELRFHDLARNCAALRRREQAMSGEVSRLGHPYAGLVVAEHPISKWSPLLIALLIRPTLERQQREARAVRVVDPPQRRARSWPALDPDWQFLFAVPEVDLRAEFAGRQQIAEQP